MKGNTSPLSLDVYYMENVLVMVSLGDPKFSKSKVVTSIGQKSIEVEFNDAEDYAYVQMINQSSDAQ